MSPNRRAFLTAAAALAAAPRAALAQRPVTGAAAKKPSTFVLVPGGYHGAWCYKRVTDRLRAHGHSVFPLTLTGLAERAHLMSPSVNLETHIADVLGVLEWEDLRDVILVGHSYGGMVITGVADRSNRVGRLVYFDALWPQDGESVSDVIGPEATKNVAATKADPAKPPLINRGVEIAKQMGAKDPKDIAWLASKLTPQPPATLTQPLRLKQRDPKVPVLFIFCTDPSTGGGVHMSYDRAKTRAANGLPVRTVTLKAPHDAMVTHPDDVTRVLVEFIG